MAFPKLTGLAILLCVLLNNKVIGYQFDFNFPSNWFSADDGSTTKRPENLDLGEVSASTSPPTVFYSIEDINKEYEKFRLLDKKRVYMHWRYLALGFFGPIAMFMICYGAFQLCITLQRSSKRIMRRTSATHRVKGGYPTTRYMIYSINPHPDRNFIPIHKKGNLDVSSFQKVPLWRNYDEGSYFEEAIGSRNKKRVSDNWLRSWLFPHSKNNEKLEAIVVVK